MPHHHQAARQRRDDAQVVRDEQISQIVPLLQVAQQIDHLRLDHHVERAGRLVEHDEARLQHHGARHRDALALAAGKFMGKAKTQLRIEADVAQGLNHALVALAIGHVGLMDLEAFLDDVGDRHARRQRSVGILEHDLHVAAERAHFLEIQALQIAAHEGDQAVRRDQPQDGAAQRRLARAGFADHAERLAFAELDGQAVAGFDVADGLAHQAAGDRKPHFELVGFQEQRRVGLRRRRVRSRLGGEQRLRIGMLRRGEHALDGAVLDDLAVLHHADPLRDLSHDAEVMGDEQKRHVQPRLDFLKQRDDLRLHGDVERGGRLVGDQQIGLVGERHRDHHALALSAGQLMRIALQPGFRVGDADLAEHFQRARAGRRSGQTAVQQQDLADLLFDGVQRIERGHRLLEHDGNVVAADPLHLAFGKLQEIAAVESDAARRMVRRRIGQQP